MHRRPPRTLAVLAALGAAAALGIAYAAETWGGLVPCALCLLERWPYRVVIVLGLLADAAIAGVHVGVEQHWWPSPLPECAAAHINGTTIAERLASMPARPAKPCDEPTFLIPALPLSIAAMNMLFALGFAAFIAILLSTGRGRPNRSLR